MDLILLSGRPCTGKTTLELNLRRIVCKNFYTKAPIHYSRTGDIMFLGPTLGVRGLPITITGMDFFRDRPQLTPSLKDVTAKTAIIALCPGYEPQPLTRDLSRLITRVYEFSLWNANCLPFCRGTRPNHLERKPVSLAEKHFPGRPSITRRIKTESAAFAFWDILEALDSCTSPLPPYYTIEELYADKA